MANVYTPYKLAGGKVVNIPNKEINQLMTVCNSRQEAVNLWLYDNNYIASAEAEALTEQAKENKILHKARSDVKQKTQRERVMKEDKTKENIVDAIANLLPSLNATNVAVTRKGKLITFQVEGDEFSIDLIRHRQKKKGEG